MGFVTVSKFQPVLKEPTAEVDRRLSDKGEVLQGGQYGGGHGKIVRLEGLLLKHLMTDGSLAVHYEQG